MFNPADAPIGAISFFPPEYNKEENNCILI